MSPTSHTPTRRLPVRAARLRGNSNPANPTTPRAGGRVTRSSAVALPVTPCPSAPSGSATKRAASPVLPVSNKRTRREHPTTGHYAEESSDEDDDEQSDAHSPQSSAIDSDDEPLLSPAAAKSKPTSIELKLKSTPAKTAMTCTKKTGRFGSKKPKSGSTAVTKHTPTKASQKSNKLIVNTQSQGDTEPPVIPPWTQLPYYVLLRIFQCAAGTPISSDAAKWLLNTSLVCRAFTEPALTALYQCPPLLTLQMAHGFANLLSKDPEQTVFNYRHKVECLEIEAGAIASKTFRGRYLDFKTLFGSTPRLAEVYLWHEKDQAPYRDLYENIKWTYPADMYLALGIASVDGDRPGDFALVPAEGNSSVPKLQSWMWSRRMLAGFPLHRLKQLHKFPAFHGLRKMVFTNFQLASVGARDPDNPDILQADMQLHNSLVQAISVLPDLRHLVMECSTVVNGQFLSQMPKSIETLELLCCWEVTADHLAEYLLSHGGALRRLALHHNQSLSLAFLPVLGAACPRLESLKMNMAYYSSLATYDTSDPAFDKLLTADQIPAWPTTLRHLDLKNLRRWDKPAAEAFFQSLLDSAPDLPDLRHLEIKAMLDIPFRERSKLRDEWGAKLKQVFLRKWVEPLPHSTLRARPQVNGPARPQAPKQTSDKKRQLGLGTTTSNPDSPSPRRSGRIATQPSGASSRASSTGRDMRDKTSRPMYAEPDTDDEILSSDEDEEDEEEGDPSGGRSPAAAAASAEAGGPAAFVQGLCDVVDVRFDNQKPVENQFRFEDFLDDDDDDPTDDDWSEDAAQESDHAYAW